MNQARSRTDGQRRLAEVESLVLTLEAVRRDLVAYREVLAKKLAWLRHPDGEAPAEEGIGQMFQKLLRGSLPLPAATGRERRMARRRAGNPIHIFIAGEIPEVEPIPGWVMDRSATGLGLWIDEEEPVGVVLRIRPIKTRDPDWWTEVVVRHCRSERGRYVVGCEFVEPVPWNQLKWFG